MRHIIDEMKIVKNDDVTETMNRSQCGGDDATEVQVEKEETNCGCHGYV